MTFISETVDHGPIIAALIAIGATIIGGIFTGGVAWGSAKRRLSTIEEYIKRHEEWSEDQSKVVDELKNITTRLDTILESRVMPFIEHHERQDELDKLR